jgi:phenylacetate-CoA ligase
MTFLFDPLRAGATALDVMTAGRARPAELAERQARRLAKLLDGAAQGSRLYAEVLKGREPGRATLSSLPVFTKAELMARFADWVTDPRLKLPELQAFTHNPALIGKPYLGEYVVWESSGTSGTPGIFVQDATAMAVYDTLEGLRRSTPRPLERLFDPLLLTERLALVSAINGHFASQVSLLRQRRNNPWLGQTSRSFSILQSPAELVAQLNDFNPSIVATYPTAAVMLAELAARGDLDIRPKEIWTGGETLTDAARQRVQDVFGTSVRNHYGASEFLCMGWECSHGHLHVNADWVILEPVDAQGRAVAPGELSHTTLLTNLANQVQPLVRYDLGQDGRAVMLLPLALSTVMEEDAGVFDFQLEQREGNTLVLRLDLKGDEAALASARCQHALKAFARAQGLKPMKVVLEPGPLPRGRSGKVKRVVARRTATA